VASGFVGGARRGDAQSLTLRQAALAKEVTLIIRGLTQGQALVPRNINLSYVIYCLRLLHHGAAPNVCVMKKGSRIKISAGEGQRKWQAFRPGLKAGAKADESAFAPLDANAVIAQAKAQRKGHPEKAGCRLTNGTFKTRRAVDGDLSAILGLYRFLQPDDPVLDSRDECVRKHWEGILRDERLRYFVAEAEGGAGDAEGGAGDAKGAVVSCCALAIVPNLTRGDAAVRVDRKCDDGAGVAEDGVCDGGVARGIEGGVGRKVLQGDAFDGEEKRGDAAVL
jgi:hypothetical protein